jgi:hypothetical protein
MPLRPSGDAKVKPDILHILLSEAGERSDSDPGSFRYAKKALNIHCIEGLNMINPQLLLSAVLQHCTCKTQISDSAFLQYCPEFNPSAGSDGCWSS